MCVCVLHSTTIMTKKEGHSPESLYSSHPMLIRSKYALHILDELELNLGRRKKEPFN